MAATAVAAAAAMACGHCLARECPSKRKADTASPIARRADRARFDVVSTMQVMKDLLL
jgi:hypothetical protein